MLEVITLLYDTLFVLTGGEEVGRGTPRGREVFHGGVEQLAEAQQRQGLVPVPGQGGGDH